MLYFKKSDLTNLILFHDKKEILGDLNIKANILKLVDLKQNVQFIKFVEKDTLYRIILCDIQESAEKLILLGKDIMKYTSNFSWKIIINQNIQNINLILESIWYYSYSFLKYKKDCKNINEFFIDIEVDTKFTNLMKSVSLCRDLCLEPANVLYPESYVEIIKDKFKDIKNVNIKVLDQKEMKKLNMNLLLGVAAGSSFQPYSVIIEYKNNLDTEENVVIIGKGVTFDTGGISLKPAKNMHHMKQDMAGSAAVISGALAVAKNQLKVNLIAIVGLVENSIGSKAQRPGDIIRGMNGTSVEVLNTDAEGRLVLADLISYSIANYNIKFMMTYATLTGAVQVALSSYAAGMFCYDEKYLHIISNSALESLEKLWRLPVGEYFKNKLYSKVADLPNIQTKNCLAGSSIAAEFLMYFAKGISYYHIDIAGATMMDCNDAQSSGYGVKQIYSICKNAF